MAEKLDTDRDSGWSVDEATALAERPRLRTNSMDPRGSYPVNDEPPRPRVSSVAAGGVPREITEAHVSGWLCKMGSKFPFNWQDRLFAFNSETKILHYYALTVANGQVRRLPTTAGLVVVRRDACLLVAWPSLAH